MRRRRKDLETFDVGAFPTPQPDAETFGADLADRCRADRGRRRARPRIQYRRCPTSAWTRIPSAEAIAVDWMQWMTTPDIQAI